MTQTNIDRREILSHEDLMNEYNPLLIKYINRKLTWGDVTEDILQEVWLAFFQKCPTPADWERLPRPLLYRIARSKCVDYYRRNNKHRILSLHHKEDSLFDPGYVPYVDPLEEIDLPELLQLRRLGYTYPELCKMFDCPLGTIKSRISKALEQVRQSVTTP